ncbi:MAG: hypothetical protein RIG82_12110 [Phycisphaeraceae bacterium]
MNRSKSQPPTLMRKLRTTPLLDLIRGRLSGRLDWRGLIERCDLPEPCRGIVLEVTRRTRLWRHERYEVAGELIAHFGDGLEAGATAETPVERFGDARQTARLIRRAKVRGRSAVYHARVWTGRGLGAVVVGYVLAAVWLSIGEPEPMSVDEIIAKINAPLTSIPDDQRAWPELKAILIAVTAASPETAFTDDRRDELEAQFGTQIPKHLAELTPNNPAWSHAENFTHDHASMIQQLIEVTRHPHLGFHIDFFYRMHTEDYQVITNTPIGDPLYPQPPEDDWESMTTAEKLAKQSTINTPLPHLGWLRRLARILEVEMVVAHQRGESARVLHCLSAISRLGDWASEQPLLISCLVDVSIKKIAIKRLGRLLQHRPDMYVNSDLAYAAHRLASMRISVSEGIDSEFSIWFEDMLDRIYNQDGQLSDEGLEFLFRLDTFLNGEPIDDRNTAPTWFHDKFFEIATSRWSFRLATPLAAVLIADRQALTNQIEKLFLEITDYGDMPLGQMIRSDPDNLIEDMASTTWTGLYYFPIVAYLPAISAAHRTPAGLRSARDALLIAIAAELYRREHNTWPADQQALVPKYLPKAFADESDEHLAPTPPAC